MIEGSQVELSCDGSARVRGAAWYLGRVSEHGDDLVTLVEACPMPMMMSSTDGQILWANRSACQLVGRDPSEILGRYMFELVAPEDLDERPLDPQRIEAGTPVHNERLLLRADGTRVWVKTLTQLKGGRILFWMSDMTELHRLETQVREAQKLETVGLLAAGLAHDLNNLLAVITGHAELLSHSTGERATRESAQCISTASERAAELTRKVLSLGRKQVLRPQVLDLNDLVSKNLSLIRSMAGGRIEVQVALCATLERVEADPVHMEQALWNLVTNACQAMERGGKLCVRTSNISLDERERASLMRPRPDPRFVVLSVEDTGPGMQEDTLRRAFDPFFTTKQSGSGLGLSVVQGIVAQSGGVVRVRSVLGAGTCFEMCLPRCEPQGSIVPPPRGSERPPLSDGTLLVVEDELLVRSWLVQALDRRGFHVLAASDANEALSLVAELTERPLALITDIRMPGLEGPELAQRVRARWPRLPILLMTAYAGDDALRALPEGAELLLKPFTAATLVERLRLLVRPDT